MGVINGQVTYIAQMCVQHGIHGRVVSLGKQDIFISFAGFCKLMSEFGLADTREGSISFHNPEINEKIQGLIATGKHLNTRFQNRAVIDFPFITDDLFYTALGFDVIDSIDITSDRDGANIIFDLNDPNISSVISTPYDLVIDSGVMEHVFDVRRVFTHITDLMKIDGFAIHSMPGNNTFDHGFYQFSPTLFRDYYMKNRFDIQDISIFEFLRNAYAAPDTSFVSKWNTFRSYPYDPSLMAKYSFGRLGENLYFTMACVKKREDSTRDQVPTQYMFTKPDPPLLSPW